MMKKIPILTLGLVFLSVQIGWAATVRLAWDPNSETDLAGYKLYYGTQSRAQVAYPESVVIDDKTATAYDIDLSSGTYFFGLSAFDIAGNESGLSNEVSTEVPGAPGKPGKPYLIQ
jgi:hypothetical protein